jgi:hypothetical protein
MQLDICYIAAISLIYGKQSLLYAHVTKPEH